MGLYRAFYVVGCGMCCCIVLSNGILDQRLGFGIEAIIGTGDLVVEDTDSRVISNRGIAFIATAAAVATFIL